MSPTGGCEVVRAGHAEQHGVPAYRRRGSIDRLPERSRAKVEIRGTHMRRVRERARPQRVMGKRALPSNACRTIPSSRSPSDRSLYSASALSTLSNRRSISTPVCTRSTLITLASFAAIAPSMELPMYFGTF